MSFQSVITGERTWHVEQGCVLDVIRRIDAGTVQCCVTSPPYWGLRDYGVAGQIGLEETPAKYVAKMVDVFREVRRVLHETGTLWLNLGDRYADSWGAQSRPNGNDIGSTLQGGSMLSARQIAEHPKRTGTGSSKRTPGLKPKDLVGIPWMVAFALREDGWWLRGDNVWGKPNGMPESVEDRPSRAHEYVFLLTKSERYSYDAEAVRTAPKASSITRLKQDVENQAGSQRANGGGKTNGPMKAVARKSQKQRGHSRKHVGFNDRWDGMDKQQQQQEGSNLRSIWWVPPAQQKEAHFAVMPEMVARICILAGCPEGGLVLDPFAGYGTTLLTAVRQGRRAIGIELNPAYVLLTRKRMANGTNVKDETLPDELPLFNTEARLCLTFPDSPVNLRQTPILPQNRRRCLVRSSPESPRTGCDKAACRELR